MANTDLEFNARYARIRLILSGLWHLVFGLIFFAVGLVPVFFAWKFNQPGTPPGDVVPWPLAFMGLFPLLLAWVTLPTGINRLRAAFEGNCYLRAGPGGVELQMPVEGRGFRHPFHYRVGRWVLPWADFSDVVRHVTTVNGIPTGSRTRLMFRDGTRLTIERCYFSESPRKIQDRLLALLRASA